MVGSALGRTCLVWIQSRETGSAEMHPGPHGKRVRNTEALGGEGRALGGTRDKAVRLVWCLTVFLVLRAVCWECALSATTLLRLLTTRRWLMGE